MAISFRLMVISVLLVHLCSLHGATSQTHFTDDVSRPSETAAAIVTQKLCQNGGTFNGSVCICLPQFNGNECQNFVATTTPGTIKRPVKVNMMLNDKFNEKYNDKASEEYKEYVGNFIEKMKKNYQTKLTKPFEVVVTDVRQGNPLKNPADIPVIKMKISLRETVEEFGVNVTHDVILELSNKENQEEYKEVFKEIKTVTEDLKDCTDCGISVSETTVEQAELDPTDQCSKPLFEGTVEDGSIVCVTACDGRHSNHKECFNGGECKVLVEPVCQCKNVDKFWYLNDDCSNPLNRIGLIAGLSATFAALLLFVAGLTTFSFINKRKQTKIKDQKKKQVNLYMEEEVEWPRPNSQAGSNKAGYNNPSYLDDNSGYAKRQSPLYRNSPPPSYPGSRPMTLSDGPNPTPQTGQWPANSRPPSSAQNQGDIPLNHLMRIRRPQVRSSWDA
ncbi:hypothetical protein OJAV_G00178840 [Oryzias javanicus]|uniref:SEA domain-containing protein n=1 Tax=Oryzias javanicus TaxID=123683 RepID=A0A3S2LSJ1_ORYJA|nr:hypothetical protein OJAV_G00178840 [Oryzias javanicus]